ncbi:hypothetical protein AX15_007002 [Amanita polypyramis BW_CC]|nr:hypothetical protein AX15_007002 [Amanita polypyramis BW_CC]
MKDALLQYYSHIPGSERGKLRVLVPGAGLGRLAWDVARLGFSCQGNEFSHYMLLGSFFILNRTDQIEKYRIYPYIHSFSNLSDHEAMLRPIRIPDVLPSDLPQSTDFSLVAGDFEEVYGGNVDSEEPHAGQWDAILTCFFIDTVSGNTVTRKSSLSRFIRPRTSSISSVSYTESCPHVECGLILVLSCGIGKITIQMNHLSS